MSEGLSGKIGIDFVDVKFVTAMSTCGTCQLLVCLKKIHKVWWHLFVDSSVNVHEPSLITPGLECLPADGRTHLTVSL